MMLACFDVFLDFCHRDLNGDFGVVSFFFWSTCGSLQLRGRKLSVILAGVMLQSHGSALVP